MEPSSNKYTMRISRLTIDKLGIQMYDRVSAVLAELIANAYDADAEHVNIKLPFGKYLARKVEGQIEDQGFAITIEDAGLWDDRARGQRVLPEHRLQSEG